MKKILSMMLVAMCVTALCPILAPSCDADVDGEGWSLKDGVLTLTKEIGGSYTPEDTFPWAQNRSEITKVIVANGVTRIAAQSFTRCENLAEVETGKDCTSIEGDAFSYDANLKKITFGCPITEFGQGVVYSSNNIESVTLTDQSVNSFKQISSAKQYNWQENGGFSNAEFTVVGTPRLTLTAAYGKIENYPKNDNAKTLMIVGGVDEEIVKKLNDGSYDLKKVVIRDETDGKKYTITEYFFDAFENRNTEADVGNKLLRLAVCDYRIVLMRDHAYTLSFEIWEGDEKLYEGMSATGAFANSTQRNEGDFQRGFADYGSIVPENPPHTYEEAGSDVKPPVQGEHTAFIALIALGALAAAAGSLAAVRRRFSNR